MVHDNEESHFAGRIGWLRAAVLGANDGIVSTASLIVGVAASHAARGEIVVAGVAGLVAGAQRYFTKSDFSDESMVAAIRELLGEEEEG